MACPKGKILNPATKRCVNISGKIGQELVKAKSPVKSQIKEKERSPKAKEKERVLPVIDVNKETVDKILEAIVYGDNHGKLVLNLNQFTRDKNIPIFVKSTDKKTNFNGYEVLYHKDLSDKNVRDLVGFFVTLFLESGDSLVDSLAETNSIISNYAAIPIVINNDIDYKVVKIA